MGKLKIKDPGSAITHFIAMIMAVFAAVPLLHRALGEPDLIHVIALGIFIVTMILLYAASTTYHTVNSTPRINKILKKLDHCMISVMIAGSYTPVCLIVLHNRTGYLLLSVVWLVALFGILLKLCWINCPKCDGVGMSACISADYPCIAKGCICLASCRWFDLYSRWNYLCIKSQEI